MPAKKITQVSFHVGDFVTWKSQTGSVTKEKTGRIVQVVPAGQRPDRERFAGLYQGPGCGYGRNHESYVVQVDVGKTEGKSFRFYWPVSSLLSHLSLRQSTGIYKKESK